MTACLTCGVWPCHEEDIYCSWCGAATRRIDVTPRTSAFTFVPRSEKSARLVLRNSGIFAASLDVGLSTGARDWLKLQAAAGKGTATVVPLREAVEDGKVLTAEPDHVLDLAPGAEAAFTLACEPPPTPRQGFVLLRGPGLDGADRAGMLRLPAVVGPAPSGSLTGRADMVLVRGSRTVVPMTVQNGPSAYLVCGQPRLTGLSGRILDAPREPIAPGQSAPLTLELVGPSTREARLKAVVEVPALGVKDPLVATINIALMEPARVSAETLTVDFGDVTEHSALRRLIRIRNQGEEELRLGEPEVSDGLKAVVSLWEPMRDHRVVQAEHEVKVVALDVDGAKIPAGEFSGYVMVPALNDPQTPSLAVKVRGRRIEVTDFPDLTAMDFGTSNSCMAALLGGRPKVLSLSGDPVREQLEIPTVISIDQTEVVIGEEALLREVTHPDQVIAGVKRNLASGGSIRVGARDYTSTQLASMIMQRLRQRATAALLARPCQVVLTAPVNFGHRAVETLKAAARDAGFAPWDEPIDEPCALAYHYLIHDRTERPGPTEQCVVVFDFGGGTLDLSLLSVKTDGDRSLIRVIDVDGVDLGGLEFDDEVVKLLLRKLPKLGERAARLDLDGLANKTTWQGDLSLMISRAQLRMRAETIKRALSSAERVPCPEGMLQDGRGRGVAIGPGDEALITTRAELEEAISPLIARARDAMKTLLERNKVAPDAVETLILAGGTSQIPAVRRALTDLCSRARVPDAAEVPPKTGVVLGAVRYGLLTGMASTGQVTIETLRNRCRYSIGVLDTLGKFREIVPRGPLPQTGHHTLSLPDRPVPIRLYKNEGAADTRFFDEAFCRELAQVPLDPRELTGAVAGNPVQVLVALTTEIPGHARSLSVRVEWLTAGGETRGRDLPVRVATGVEL